MKRTVIQAAVLVCFLVVFGAPIFAQNYGEITGTITDPSSAVIIGATVTVTNAATNIARSVQTNSAGSYSLPFLVPGVYNVQAMQAGFKVVTRPSVQLQVGAVVRIDFTLELGGATEAVQVSGGAALLATDWLPPAANVLAPSTFGVISSAKTMRDIQAGAEISLLNRNQSSPFSDSMRRSAADQRIRTSVNRSQ